MSIDTDTGPAAIERLSAIARRLDADAELQAWMARESLPLPELEADDTDPYQIHRASQLLDEYRDSYRPGPGRPAAAAWTLYDACRVHQVITANLATFLHQEVREAVEELLLTHVAECIRVLELATGGHR